MLAQTMDARITESQSASHSSQSSSKFHFCLCWAAIATCCARNKPFEIVFLSLDLQKVQFDTNSVSAADELFSPC